MAEKMNEWPFETVTSGKYPWKEWFDGSVWKLTSGIDFKVDLKCFRSAMYGVAKRHGVKLRTKVDGDCFYIQALKD